MITDLAKKRRRFIKYASALSSGWVWLQQNLLYEAGSLFEGFETTGDWSSPWGNTIAANTTEVKEGTQSIKVTTVGPANLRVQKTINQDMSSFQRLLFWFYIHDTLANYNSSLQIWLANDSSAANAFKYWTVQSRFRPGWNVINVSKRRFTTAAGSPTWSSNILLHRYNYTGTTNVVNFSFDKNVWLIRGIPAIILRFDDGFASQYTDVYQYMKTWKIPGTIYMEEDRIGVGGGLTAAQLQEMDADGWCIANHGDGTDLTTLTEAQQEANLTSCKNTLDGLGLTKASNHVAYPLANKNEDTYTAMANTGMLTGQIGTSPEIEGYEIALPCSDLYAIASKPVYDTSSLNSIKTMVDNAITDGMVLSLTFHNIGAAGEWSLATFQEFIQYVRSKAKARLIYPITIDDFYQLTLGPKRVRLVK